MHAVIPIAAVVMLCACGGRAPASPGARMSESVAIRFSGFAVSESREDDARWPAGTAARVQLVLTNTGPPLMDYPSVALESHDPRVVVVDGRTGLYGLVVGETPLEWAITASEPIPAGAELPFTVRAYEHTLSGDQAPLGVARFEVVLGEALLPR